jgi:hypothetical protein
VGRPSRLWLVVTAAVAVLAMAAGAGPAVRSPAPGP